MFDDSDWRDFRAKLVMGETKEASGSRSTPPPPSDAEIIEDADGIGDLDGIGSIFMDSSRLPTNDTTSKAFSDASSTASAAAAANKMTPLDPSQWAYESGKVIEQGAVILGGVEQAFGFGLRQQYFHKAAILVLDHEENTFTKGIILNRPTDLTLEDDINPGVRWRVWFGGDVQGLNSAKPDIVCLHSLKNEQATKASIKVMKDIKWTTFENAKRLVQIGAAQPTDFWVFMGYAGWGAGQLMGELNRKSWYMVATDSQTLLKELARQSAASDPREAGLDTWTLLMDMIGRSGIAKEYTGDFDDLMLKEWALGNLLSAEAGGGGGERDLSADAAIRGSPSFPMESTPKRGGNNDPLFGRLMNRMTSRGGGDQVQEGSVLRASPADRSPFLLQGQEYHKSVVLVLSEENGITVGAILNRPASKGLDIQIRDKSTGEKKKVMVPLRFGGQYTVKGSEALLWLHSSSKLRDADVGAPVGGQEDGIWKCTAEDVISAIGRHIAKPEDFVVVSGVSVWGTVPGKSQAGGIQEEVDKGKFELVPDSNIKSVWNALSKQDVLTSENLSLNLELATEAWNAGAGRRNGKMNGAFTNGRSNGKENDNLPPMSGLGDGFDEEDDSLVFKSSVKVSALSDDALRSWVKTFLLGLPSMQG
ncbi:UPF0301 protein [Seminavis robusta]|uniref:UPF0301 protein n=1 Tax=Seminavis robusta TaxID=568900 RepID=A0A9N8DL66_9STRA|nr:UPF0301 protein [Seminavis robusta]|eukprot:Sro203_g085580.1 UPF0301 protein (647) ;mRNA; f:44462-46663